MRRALAAATFLLANLLLASSSGMADERLVCPYPTAPLRDCTRAPNEQLHYEPAVVRLSGLLVTDYVYGPPGFGEEPEADYIARVWILKLFTPVDVIGTPGDDFNSESVNDVGRVGLIDGPEVKLNPFLGQRVVLEGTLFHRMTHHQHEEVMLTVHKVVTRLKAKPPRPSVGTVREIPAPE
jgi:hypothetical protein